MACQEEPQRMIINVRLADEIRGPPDAYKNQSRPRGALFISNCKRFDDSDRYEERLGSDSDVHNVKNLFTKMGYDCICTAEDFTREELLKELDSFKDHEIHQEVDSLVAVFMSHGDDGKLLTRDGKKIKVEDICNKFDNISCPILQDKPKVFFFQHCRGKTETAIPDIDFATDGRAITPEPRNYLKPGLSHTFLCFSTRKGFVSYRHERRGGVFIENLCKVFMEKAKDKRLNDLIAEVNSILSKSDCQQSCEIRFIDHHYPFYFNPCQTYPLSFSQDDSSSVIPEVLEGVSFESEGPLQYLSAGFDEEMGFQFLEGERDYIKLNSLTYTVKRKASFQQHTSQQSTHGALKKAKLNNYVFILSYLSGCDEDIKKLESKFSQMAFKVIIVPPVQTLDDLKKIIRSNVMRRDSMAIVFFFGEGFENDLYLGKDSTESVSFKEFAETFKGNRMRKCSTILFTNTCFKYKSSTTILRSSPQPSWNVFHLCVKVNGDCSKGSLFTRVFLEDHEKSKEEFAEFACRVKKRVEDLSADDATDEDEYIVDIRYYGVYSPCQFPHDSV